MSLLSVIIPGVPRIGSVLTVTVDIQMFLYCVIAFCHMGIDYVGMIDSRDHVLEVTS